MTRLLLALLCGTLVLTVIAAQTPQPVTIRVGRLIDGKGSSQQNVVVTLNGSKIVSIGKSNGPVTYDLSKYTLLPGFIDVHVHILWHFGPDGRFAGGREDATVRIQAGVENAKATVMGGFTTVQSVGEAADLDLRKKLDDEHLPGPRILTSVRQITNTRATPEELRQNVRDAKAAGADVIKIFASASIRDGGKQTMSDEQMAAICGESNAIGMRSMVHAHSAESIKASAKRRTSTCARSWTTSTCRDRAS